MKTYFKIVLILVLAIGAFVADAGDFNYCYTPGRDCSATKGCGKCDNHGYAFVYGGYSFTWETQGFFPFAITDAPYFDPPSETYETSEGYIVGAGVGISSQFICGSRFEIEGLYTKSDVNRVLLGGTYNGAELTGVDSAFSTSAMMVNFLKEFHIGCVTAYAGAGIGIAATELDFKWNGFYGSDTDYSFAHQFIVGADFPVSDCMSLFLQYKLLGIGDVNFECPGGYVPAGANNAVPGTLRPSKYVEMESYYSSHLVMGARFCF